jgi:hypothetical protein
MNIKALFNAYAQFKQNPSKVLKQLNIPEEYQKNPQDAIQYLMNSGRISQADYNNANNQLKQMQNNPLIKQYFNNQG